MIPSEEFELTDNSLVVHIETQAKLIFEDTQLPHSALTR